jgi:hypothetical protein
MRRPPPRRPSLASAPSRGTTRLSQAAHAPRHLETPAPRAVPTGHESCQCPPDRPPFSLCVRAYLGRRHTTVRPPPHTHHCEPPIKARARLVQLSVHRGPPWPPPRSTDSSDTPSRIHRGSSRHLSPHPAPPLAGRHATAAAARVCPRGSLPVLFPPRPSEGIEHRRPPGHPAPASGRPRRRCSPKLRRPRHPAARGPHCIGRHLSRVVSVK